MPESARHLQAVNPITGEVVEIPDEIEELKAQIDSLNKVLVARDGLITKLRNELATATGLEPEAEDILEVLVFWNETLKGSRCKIVVGGERWLKVRARLREKDMVTGKSFTKLDLKAAVVGCSLSDFHMSNGHTDAVTIFRDSKTVDDHIARAVSFKRRHGESALALIDELAGKALEWLALRCKCEHTYFQHLLQGPRPDGTTPCCVEGCDCEHMDMLWARVERWKAEQGGDQTS